MGVDAVGWRVNGSIGYTLAGTGSVDVIFNLRTMRGNAYGSLGGQGVTGGGSVSTGILLIGNLVDNAGYRGLEAGFTGSIAREFVGVDISLTWSWNLYKGKRPWVFYLGYAAGEEVTVGLTGSHTWTYEEILKFFGIY